MSSKTARRKTLSHSEIESFLSEISVPSDSNSSSNNCLNNQSVVNTEDFQKTKTNVDVSSVKFVDIENKENSPIRCHDSLIPPPFKEVDKSVEEYLREYCKVNTKFNLNIFM